jgi:hypothetical protein
MAGDDANGVRTVIWAKTEAGRREIQERALVRERARRNLLLVIDGVQSEAALLASIAGIGSDDFRALEAQGLIAPVQASSRSGSARSSRPMPLAGRAEARPSASAAPAGVGTGAPSRAPFSSSPAAAVSAAASGPPAASSAPATSVSAQVASMTAAIPGASGRTPAMLGPGAAAAFDLPPAESIDPARFTAALGRLISSQLGLRGFVLTLALEKASSAEDLQAIAQRALEQIRERKGDPAFAAARHTLYGV